MRRSLPIVFKTLAVWLNLVMCSIAFSDEITVAVASNFAPTLKLIVQEFEAQSEHRVILSTGSTGRHYAQIKNGAPFDVFFAADAERPQLLEADGLALANSRFTYARGQLVLWSPNATVVDEKVNILRTLNFRHIAIANPKLAPYGLAAQELLIALDLWEQVQSKIVKGENIAQAFQFVDSGNADLGFIAWSQLQSSAKGVHGSYWKVPDDLHSPIDQQAVLLSDAPAASAFLSFVKSRQSRQLIQEAGYL